MRSLLDIGAHPHVGRKYGNLARTEVMNRKPVVALLAGLLVSGAVVSSPRAGRTDGPLHRACRGEGSGSSSQVSSSRRSGVSASSSTAHSWQGMVTGSTMPKV